jgi:PKD repeat protein
VLFQTPTGQQEQTFKAVPKQCNLAIYQLPILVQLQVGLGILESHHRVLPIHQHFKTQVHTYASNGTYTVTLTITDNAGCANTYSHPVVINAPITLSLLQPLRPLCNGGTNGSIAVTPSGGFGASTGYYLPSGYDYTWFDGTKGSSHVGLTAGTYTVTATDGVCSATGTYTLNQPTALSAVVSKTDANCGIYNGTAINHNSPEEHLHIQVLTGVPGSQGQLLTGLSPGTFIADFHDANGCSSLLQYSATIGSLPCGVTSSITTTNVSCFGGANGTATLTVTGSFRNS